jgi:uncharacterized protein (AIM24 family)
VIIAGAGTFIDLNPADFGGRIEVDTGCVVAFEDGIRYGVVPDDRGPGERPEEGPGRRQAGADGRDLLDTRGVNR